MPRQARVVAVGVPHHITQRGSNRNQVFFAEQDHLVYLRLLAKYAKAYHLRMLGYCYAT
jgi:putative transposase